MRHAAFLLSLSFLAGCAGYDAKPVTVLYAGAMTHTAERGPVRVGANAYFDPDLAEEVFGHEVVFQQSTLAGTNYGYLPVLVAIDNHSDDTFVVDKTQTRLISRDGKRAKTRSWLEMYATFEPSVVGAYMVGGIVNAALQDDANRDMAEDWRAKELPDDTVVLPHSQANGGFLYFKDRGGVAPYLLQVHLRNARTDEPVVVNVLIDG